MLNNPVVYIEKNNCLDCYKCIKECFVKAIKIDNKKALIDPLLCVNCGHCNEICPSGSIKARNDLDRVKELVLFDEKIIVSLDTSYKSEFSKYSDNQIIAAIKSLGISDVSETAIGAEIVADKTINYIKDNHEGVYFSSTCPSIVSLICKYYPEYKNNLIPLMSPMLSHAKMLKKMYGDEVKVVHVGPCIAKKMEADEYSQYVDAVITYKDLSDWMDDEFVHFSDFDTNNEIEFIPEKSTIGNLFSIEGGILTCMQKKADENNISLMSFSGFKKVELALKELNLQELKGKIFVELSACDGSCINGPASKNHESSIIKKQSVFSATDANKKKQTFQNISIDKTFNILPVKKTIYSENQIAEVLESIGKFSNIDEYNCGACGYTNCKNFAKAILDGKADRTMCVPYMKKVAFNKTSAILHKIPYGIILINDDLRVIEANINFAKILGEDIEMIFKNKPGLENADLKKLLPCHSIFKSVLDSGEELIEENFEIAGKTIQISIVNIQKNKIICAIMRDMQLPYVTRELVVERARKVIDESRQTVQNIAYLLGENASHTEAMLNSIIESNQSL